MDFSPEDVEQHEFLLSVPGYNRAEVRAFLQAVATQIRQRNASTPVPNGGSVRAELEQQKEDEDEDQESAAIDELLRAAEIRIEDAGTRLVGQVESVREEIAHLLRSLDQRVDELTATMELAAQTQPEEQSEVVNVEVVSAPFEPEPEPGSEQEPKSEPDFQVEVVQEMRSISEPEPTPAPEPIQEAPEAPIHLEEAEEDDEIPPDWSELFVEPRMDPST